MTSVRPSGPLTTPLKQPVAELARWAASVLLALLLAATLLVVCRRFAGALSQPLDTGSLAFVAVLVATAAGVVRILQHPLTIDHHEPLLAGWIAVSLGVVVLGITLSLPGTGTLGLITFWSILVLEELIAWGPIAQRVRRRSVLKPAERKQSDIASPESPLSTDDGDVAAEAAIADPEVGLKIGEEATESAETWSDADTVETRLESNAPGTESGDVLQQLTRSRAADGTERLVGWLRMPLAAGQRTASVHVAFCPPFQTNPAIEVEQLEGPDGRIKTAQLMPHGVRLDLKLRQKADEACDVFLQFSAVSASEDRNPV